MKKLLLAILLMGVCISANAQRARIAKQLQRAPSINYTVLTDMLGEQYYVHRDSMLKSAPDTRFDNPRVKGDGLYFDIVDKSGSVLDSQAVMLSGFVETITSIALSDSMLTYINEGQDTTRINLKQVVLSYETATNVVLNGDGTATLVNEKGDSVTWPIGWSTVDVVQDSIIETTLPDGTTTRDTIRIAIPPPPILLDTISVSGNTLQWAETDGDTGSFDVSHGLSNSDSLIYLTGPNGDTLDVVNIGPIIRSVTPAPDTVTLAVNNIQVGDSTLVEVCATGAIVSCDTAFIYETPAVDYSTGQFVRNDSIFTESCFTHNATVICDTFFTKAPDVVIPLDTAIVATSSFLANDSIFLETCVISQGVTTCDTAFTANIYTHSTDTFSVGENTYLEICFNALCDTILVDRPDPIIPVGDTTTIYTSSFVANDSLFAESCVISRGVTTCDTSFSGLIYQFQSDTFIDSGNTYLELCFEGLCDTVLVDREILPGDTTTVSTASIVGADSVLIETCVTSQGVVTCDTSFASLVYDHAVDTFSASGNTYLEVCFESQCDTILVDRPDPIIPLDTTTLAQSSFISGDSIFHETCITSQSTTTCDTVFSGLIYSHAVDTFTVGEDRFLEICFNAACDTISLSTPFDPSAVGIVDSFMYESCCDLYFSVVDSTEFCSEGITSWHLVSEPDSGFVNLNTNGSARYTRLSPSQTIDSFQYSILCDGTPVDTTWVFITPTLANVTATIQVDSVAAGPIHYPYVEFKDATQGVPCGECLTIEVYLIDTSGAESLFETATGLTCDLTSALATTMTGPNADGDLHPDSSVFEYFDSLSVWSDAKYVGGFDKFAWSMASGYNESISGAGSNVAIRFEVFVGGSCARNSSPEYFVQSSNTNNSDTITWYTALGFDAEAEFTSSSATASERTYPGFAANPTYGTLGGLLEHSIPSNTIITSQIPDSCQIAYANFTCTDLDVEVVEITIDGTPTATSVVLKNDYAQDPDLDIGTNCNKVFNGDLYYALLEYVNASGNWALFDYLVSDQYWSNAPQCTAKEVFNSAFIIFQESTDPVISQYRIQDTGSGSWIDFEINRVNLGF